MTDVKRKKFLEEYFSNPRSIVLLFVVCAFIAVCTHLFNQLGLLINFGFSLGFGIPISLLESFLRTRRRPWPDMVINVVSVVGGCLIGIVLVYSFLVFNGYIPFGFFGPLLFINFAIAMFFSASAFYFFWSLYRTQALTLALQAEKLKAAESENMRQTAENRLLQSQMEPHFLFNTLANIQSLIDFDSEQAKQTVADLSNMLRAAMTNASRDRCQLDQELELVRAYLNIQKVRFGDRLKVTEHIDPTLLNEPVLPMLVQPLVENSVKHAAEASMQSVTIEIIVRQDDGLLKIEVVNDGGQTEPNLTGNGISLNNIRQRLELQFGSQASLHSQPTENGWRSRLTLPMSEQKE